MALIEEVICEHSKEAQENPFPSSYNIEKKLWEKVQGIESDPFLQIEEKTFYWSRLNGKKRKKVTNQLLTKWTNIKRCRTFETFKEGYSLWRVDIVPVCPL